MSGPPTDPHVIDQLGDIKEMVEDVRASALTKDEVRDAVAAGFISAIGSDQFWSTLSDGMQRHATTQAGGWLLGSLKAALSRLFLFLVLGLLVYMVGGWSGLVALFKGSANA